MLVCTCQDPAPFVNLGEGFDARWWVHTECERPTEAWLRSLGDDMLNIFIGGPHDGNAFTTTTLLENQAMVSEYAWTPEVVISQRTNASARVWRHTTDDGAEPQQSPAPAVAEEDSDHLATVTTEEEEPPMENLKERRVALKISRAALSESSGVSQAKIGRIESDSKRTTDEERGVLSKALDKMEKDLAASQPKGASEASAQGNADAPATS